ncbi:MAG: dTDP-4-dehydrorhamnose 3,5-epimerase [Rhizobiaceae bacterium]
MPKFTKLELDGVVLVSADRFGDDRGFFSETYNQKVWQENGISVDFVQDNHSVSSQTGTLRGLHFQTPPFAQAKLVRVTRGSVFDVAVDIRRGSPTFGKWVGVTLSAKEWNQLYIPAGFAHGFVTLEDNTEFLYKVSAFYSKECDRSIRFDDPSFSIEWPIETSKLVLSEKDKNAPLLKDIDTGFIY